MQSGDGSLSGVEFRTLRREDVPALKELQDLIYPVKYPDSFYEGLFESCERRRVPFGFVLLAWSSGRLAGALACAIREPNSVLAFVLGRIEGYVMTFGVAREWRRRGLGVELLRRGCAQLKALGCSAVTLHVQESNSAARAFYRRMGFAEVRRIEEYYCFGAEPPENGQVGNGRDDRGDRCTAPGEGDFVCRNAWYLSVDPDDVLLPESQRKRPKGFCRWLRSLLRC